MSFLTASILAATKPATAASRPQDNRTQEVSSKRGHEFELFSPFSTVEFEISANASGFSTAELYDPVAATTVATKDVSNLSAGDIFAIDADYQAQKYYITLGNNGSSFTAGRYDNPSYPYTSTDVDITAEVVGTETFAGNAWNIVAIGGLT
jgi:hypothetical protein